MHCTSAEPSETGDPIGHCQKCKAFNQHDKAADLLHPVTAIKFKKSLLANLRGPALGQMITLVFCALAMLVCSCMLAVFRASNAATWDELCTHGANDGQQPCVTPRTQYLYESLGTWGGFNSSAVIASLPQGSLASEQAAFWISNGKPANVLGLQQGGAPPSP